MKEQYLIELAKKNEPQAWVGIRPPFNMESLDLLNSTNYRVASSFHQRFRIVWLYEHMLSDIKENGWKILLDEAIRLIGEEGYIVIRSKECEKITIVEIKHFFGRRFGIDVEVSFERFDNENNIWTVCLKIIRKNIDRYNDKSWSFAILTSGKKVENVLEFLKSVRNYDQHNEHEIIISGPQNVEYDKYCVKYLDLSPFRDNEYAEISRKKNALAQMATHANLLIVHDRFVLNENFFEGFDKYGYDFDFITIKQYYESGAEYPAYCCMKNAGLTWSSPYIVDNYKQLYVSQYLNGGLLIFKTDTLKEIGFNSLLMWNQMEDVELCKTFMIHGIVPRMNYISSAVTIGIDESYTETFNIDRYGLQIETNPFECIKVTETLGGIQWVLLKVAKHLPDSLKRTKAYLAVKSVLIK